MNEYLEEEIAKANIASIRALQVIQQIALALSADIINECPDPRHTNDLHSDLSYNYKLFESLRVRLAALHDVHDSILENWVSYKKPEPELEMEESSGCVFNDLNVEKPDESIIDVTDDMIESVDILELGNTFLERLESFLGGVQKYKAQRGSIK